MPAPQLLLGTTAVCVWLTQRCAECRSKVRTERVVQSWGDNAAIGQCHSKRIEPRRHGRPSGEPRVDERVEVVEWAAWDEHARPGETIGVETVE